MSDNTEAYYRKLAARCASDAEVATLTNVRERCLRAEEAWLKMADQMAATAEHKVRNQARRAMPLRGENEPWSYEEDAELRRLVEARAYRSEIAGVLARSGKAVAARAFGLGLQIAFRPRAARVRQLSRRA